MSILEDLRKRKLVQWALAYLAAAWLVMQLIDVLGGRWGVSDQLARSIDLVLVIGFFIVLVLAWYHGDQGRQRVSGPELLIIAGLCAVGVLLLNVVELDASTPETATEEPSAGPADSQPSVAVLPFSVRSEERQDEFFAAGIHDDLLTSLAKIDGLKVISRTSVMQYLNTTKTVRLIARELNVGTVLEGSVQRGGDRIRVNAKLIDAPDGEQIWATSYDEELSVANIFQIQSSLASRIADALNAELMPGVRRRIDAQPTDNLHAWDLATRGQYMLDKGRVESDLVAAHEFFLEATVADPEFARAWSGLARSIFELAAWHYRPEEEFEDAAKAALRALELDPDLSSAHTIMGDLHRVTLKFDAAQKAVRRAIELSPGNASARTTLSELLRDRGQKEEAVAQTRISIGLDPRSMRVREILLQNLYFNEQYEDLLEEARKMLELEADAAYAWYWAGMSHAWLGNKDQALEASRKAVEIGGDAPYLAAGLAFTYAMTGEADLAAEMLETAEEDGWPLVEISLVYAWLPDSDRAFEHLFRGLDERPTSLMYISTDPGTQPLHGDPRWQEFQRRLDAELYSMPNIR